MTKTISLVLFCLLLLAPLPALADAGASSMHHALGDAFNITASVVEGTRNQALVMINSQQTILDFHGFNPDETTWSPGRESEGSAWIDVHQMTFTAPSSTHPGTISIQCQYTDATGQHTYSYSGVLFSWSLN